MFKANELLEKIKINKNLEIKLFTCTNCSHSDLYKKAVYDKELDILTCNLCGEEINA